MYLNFYLRKIPAKRIDGLLSGEDLAVFVSGDDQLLFSPPDVSALV